MRCLFLLFLSLQVAWSATAATYTDSWLFFTSLSTTQFHNKLPSCFQYCITCRQSNKKSKNVSPDTKLLLLCQPGRVGNKADEPLNKWCFIKIHCKKLDISVLSISSQSSVFNHMHRSRRLTSVPSRSQACPWTLTYYEVFNSFILMYLKCVFQCQMEGKR